MKVFDDSFLAAITSILEERCIDGACVKAGDICQALNLDEKEFRGIISTLIRIDALPEYRNYLGPGRGIGRVDTPPPKKAPAGSKTKLDIPDHFLDELVEVLSDLCGRGSVVSTKIITDKMETAVSKSSRAMVSAAIKEVRRPELEAYQMKSGRHGGVCLKDPVAKLTKPLDTDLEDSQIEFPVPSIHDSTRVVQDDRA